MDLYELSFKMSRKYESHKDICEKAGHKRRTQVIIHF